MRRRNSNTTKTASLRWRLTAVSLVLLAAALVALDIVIYINMHSRDYSDLQTNLAAVIAHTRDISPSAKDSPQKIANMISRSNVVAVVYRPGQFPVTGKPTGFEPPKLPRVSGHPATTDESWALLMAAVNSDPDLIWQATTPFAGSADSVLFVASKRPVEAALQRLLITELIGTLLVLGLAIVIVGVAVRLTLRPLDRMAAVAEEISAGDISRRMRPSNASTELGKLATSFDAMLDSLAKSLVSERAAREQANRSERRMRDFLSDASHELRTPIAGLQWSAEALLRNGNRRERRERLSFQIAKQARRASQLVADLLVIARLDQGVELERVHFDLASLAEEEVERVRDLEPGIDLRLSVEVECPLVADTERIRRVIGNVIDNACKAIDHNGEIEVSVRPEKKAAVLEIRDSGPGVPDEDRERIFERFVRLDESRPRSADGSGSGLGLAISRGIAEAHGGTLVCAESDSGARFVLSLPLAMRAKRRARKRVSRVGSA
ncbi:MAG: ATP-binding protein [Gaiellaceae bacterium]